MPAKKKQLSLPVEEFFELCMLEVGRPESPFHFVCSKYGSPFYRLDEFPVGRRFLTLTSSMGEAKARAWELYKRYYIWYMKQESASKIDKPTHDLLK